MSWGPASKARVSAVNGGRRHGGRGLALAAVLLGFALSAAPASAVMVRLPGGGYANYAGLSSAGGSSSGQAPTRFDAAFSNLDYSGGPVMAANTDYVVEWAPSGYSGTPYQVAGGYAYNYVNGVAKFFTDMAHDSGLSTNVDSVSSQYNDSTSATAAYNLTYGGLLIDTDPLPANGCSVATLCLTDAQIQHELETFLGNSGLPADLSHEYFLLTPPSVVSCFDAAGSECSGQAPQSSAAFCAYHSMTMLGYVYANIPDLTGVVGCDPFHTFCPSGKTCAYDNGPADGVLSAVSHEHNESVTDPQPNNAWTDWQPGCTGASPETCGGEIGDKCNGDAFTDPSLQPQISGSQETPYNQVINGAHYLLQMEWSNQGHRCADHFAPSASTASSSFTATPGSGSSVAFDASASTATGGVSEYVWQFNDAQDGTDQSYTVETTSPTTSYTFSAAGSYVVALTVMGPDGTSNGSAQTVVVGTPAPGATRPTAAFTSPATAAAGSTITFSGAASTDPNPSGSLSYIWNFGDGTNATGEYASHTFHAGDYVVSLTVIDSASGLTDTTANGIVVSAPPVPTASFNPPSGIVGTSVAFTGWGSSPDASIASYHWDFGDGTTASGASVSHVFARPGTYAVSLTVTDSNGQSATNARAVTILPRPCTVPSLKGDSLARARTVLAGAHCALGTVKSPRKPKRSAGRRHRWVLVVAGESPGAHSARAAAYRVALTLAWRSVRV